MKHLILTLCSFFIILSANFGQSTVGLKFGLSTFEMEGETLFLKDSEQNDYIINYEGKKYGLHVGVYGDFQFTMFSIQPALIFNTTKINYGLEDIHANSIVKSLKFYNNLDVPVLFGLNLSRLRIHAGPVAHIMLGSVFEIIESEDYSEKFTTASYGYQAGLSFRLLWNMRVEVNYEGNFDRFGEHFIYKETEYQFSDRPHRFIVSLCMNLI